MKTSISNSVKYSTAGALLLLSMASTISAQSSIELASEERSRLGIITRAATAADNSQGVHVPGMVISSPLQAGQLIPVYSGTVMRWLVESGAKVTAGTVLAELGSPELLVLQRDWMQARTDLDQATFDLEKDRMLFEEGVISRRRLAATERSFGNAEFALGSSTEALRSAGFNEAALQNLAASGNGLGVYVVRAAIDGVLSHRAFEAGERVEAGMVLGEVAGDGNVWVEAGVPAAYARILQPGQVLRLVSGEQLRIRLKDAAIDDATQTFDIHGELLANSHLMPGEVVSVVLSDAAGGVWIPASAVVHNNHETTVYVSTSRGFEGRTLMLTPSGSGYVATTGLSAGEEVVIQGTAVLKGIELGLGGDE